jgi:hypothetical protein
LFSLLVSPDEIHAPGGYRVSKIDGIGAMIEPALASVTLIPAPIVGAGLPAFTVLGRRILAD